MNRQPDYNPEVDPMTNVSDLHDHMMLEAAMAQRAADHELSGAACDGCQHLVEIKLRGAQYKQRHCTLIGQRLQARVESCNRRSVPETA